MASKTDNHYFAGKVKHRGDGHILFIRVRQKGEGSRKFYVHEVFTEDEVRKSEELTALTDIRELRATAVGQGKGLSDFYRSIVGSVLNVNEQGKVDTTEQAQEEPTEQGRASTTKTAEGKQFEREYKAVEKRYKGTEQWLKAHNNKPSNLNKRQWVLMRTPRFKK